MVSRATPEPGSGSLPEAGIDKSSFVPAYAQVMELLEETIRSGQFLPERPLPSEADLARRFGLSRMTVRRALALLAEKGLVFTRQGKGTFVAQPRLANVSFRLEELPEFALNRGMSTSSRLLEANVLRAPAAVAAVLQVPPTARVLYIRRLFLADNEPLACDRKYLPYEKGKPYLEAEIEYLPLHQIVNRHSDVLPVSNEVTIRAVSVDEDDARVLGVSPGDPAFQIEETLLAVGGKPVAWGKTVCRGDRYQLTAPARKTSPGRRIPVKLPREEGNEPIG